MNTEIPKVNVNIGLYLISLVALGIGEMYALPILMLTGIVSGLVSFISIIYVLPAYTKNYRAYKLKKYKEHSKS